VFVVWDEFLKIMTAEAGSQVVETWFKAVSFEAWNPALNTVTLRVPNQFISSWIQEHYIQLLKIHLARLLQAHDIRLFFIVQNEEKQERTIIPASVAPHSVIDTIYDYNVDGHQSTRPDNKTPDSSSQKINNNEGKYYPPVVSSKKNLIEKKNKEKEGTVLNEHYVFSSFIVGPANSLAHAAAVAVSENLGKVYNPLFIYGGTGLGKTHLLHAIGNAAKKKDPSCVVRYESTDHFINEFINCIRFDKSGQFRTKYQRLDLLLLDDVQFLSNKEQTQEIFFHIFNTLYEQQKQIILSSDTFPKEITGLQSRLKSRMEWGLVADVQMPDLETKIAILKKKAEMHATYVPDDVADFIASKVISNIRELEGALVRIGAFASLTGQEITLDLARKVLLNLNETKREGVMLDTVLKVVAKQGGVSITDIKSKTRQKDVTVVRQIALYLMKKLTFCSLQVIGNYMGGRDHSTVIHAIEKVETMIACDALFAKKLKLMEQEIFMS
jgi:chromosomal replication initiator protein